MLVDRGGPNLVVPGRDARGRVTVLPPALQEKRWQPGTSGNPEGRGGLYYEVRRLCREASPDGVRRMTEIAKLGDRFRDADGNLQPLTDRDDKRAIAYAINWLIERGFGPPKPYDPNEERMFSKFDPSRLTPVQRDLVRQALELIAQASE